MNRKEIADIITLSGIGGLEKEIKKREWIDFKGWLIAYLCIIACGCIILHRDHNQSKAEIQQFKYDYASKVGKQYGMAMDSLVKISQNNGIENCVKK